MSLCLTVAAAAAVFVPSTTSQDNKLQASASNVFPRSDCLRFRVAINGLVETFSIAFLRGTTNVKLQFRA